MHDQTAEDDTAEGAPVEVGIYDIVKRFGDATAVDDVTLEIRRGEFFSLLGPSGCGKTTTLRMVAGFEEPDAGRILLSGADIAGVPPYERNVNTVFQSYALFPHLSVWDNVAFGLRRKKRPKDEVKARVDRYLAMVELAHLADRRPGQLSGGQQQRVALARALVNEPAVLLLDEPLGALDLKLRKQMQLELMRIQREVGITFVYVTHDQEEALVMSDRLVVMNAGSIEQVGYPEDVYERPATRFVAGFIGTSNIFDGRVRDRDGDLAVLDTPDGDRLAVKVPEGRTVGIGDEISVTVRPEKLAMLDADAPVTDGRCSVGGTITEVVYQGVSTQYVVLTDTGETIVAFRQNSERVRDAGVPGTRTRLAWDPEHNVVVAGVPGADGSDVIPAPSPLEEVP